LSDYPSKRLIMALERNVEVCLPLDVQSRVDVIPFEWGTDNTALSCESPNGYDLILAGDMLWMSEQHRNLALSMSQLLRKDKHARILVVAGFHTGRVKMRTFFPIAASFALVPAVPILEINADGSSRPWEYERGAEDFSERNRWMVLCWLKWGHLS